MFQQLFIQESNFNPFEHITIASACNRDLIENRLTKLKIASEPTFGWNGKQGNQSKEALQWLQWLDYEKRKNVSEEERQFHDQMKTPPHQHPAHRRYIQHAGNGGEKFISEIQTTVDGYDPETNTIYQYHGCYWHGCTTCYTNQTESHFRHAGRQMYEVRENTRRTTQTLRRAGYQVIEIWGCEWAKTKKEDVEIKEFVSTLEYMDRLKPRDAFFGGTTNAAKLYHKCRPGEKIPYVDFTSLYPTINKYGQYPIKHPEIILNPEDQNVENYYGIAKCKVRAPKGLHHPVLPVRVKDKLMFPLCVRCAEEQLELPMLERSCRCPHTDLEREFVGTWCTPELMVAKEKGYDIVQIYEVYHFAEDQRETGLFSEYVYKWYRLKLEASGWPKNVHTEEEKRQFIQEFKDREKIELRYEELEKGGNPGLRSLAKLMLNSMWGKFGQRTNKTQVAHFTSPDDFHDFLESDKYVIQKFQTYPNNDDVLDVFYTHKDDYVEINGRTNIFIAAFTTCLARLMLYTELDKAGTQVLYYDTDSIIMVVDTNNPNHYVPTTGDYLGDFTDELIDKKTGISYPIDEYVSAGPKNYGYVQTNGKIECKVKGFSLNSEGTQYLNYQLMRDNALSELNDPLLDTRTGRVIPCRHQVRRSHRIVRNPKDFSIQTVAEEKRYQMVYEKRVVDPDTYQTYPYGYGEINLAEEELEQDIHALLDLLDLLDLSTEMVVMECVLLTRMRDGLIRLRTF